MIKFDLSPEIESKEHLNYLIKTYLDLIEKYPVNVKIQKSSGDDEPERSINFLMQLKRQPSQIGPYGGISFFEMANRIASDLVLLSGSKILFENPSKIGVDKIYSIELKMGHEPGFDMLVSTDAGLIPGEGFNVAESLFTYKIRYIKDKLGPSINKWKKQNGNKDLEKQLILFGNEDVFDKKKGYWEKKKEKWQKSDEVKKGLHFIPCKIDDLWAQ